MPLWYPSQSWTIWTLGDKWSVHLTVGPVSLKLSHTYFLSFFCIRVNMYCLKLINQLIDVNILPSAIKVSYLKV